MGVSIMTDEVSNYSKRVKDIKDGIEESFNNVQDKCRFDLWEGNAKNSYSNALLSLKNASDVIVYATSGISTKVQCWSQLYHFTEMGIAQSNQNFQ